MYLSKSIFNQTEGNAEYQELGEIATESRYDDLLDKVLMVQEWTFAKSLKGPKQRFSSSFSIWIFSFLSISRGVDNGILNPFSKFKNQISSYKLDTESEIRSFVNKSYVLLFTYALYWSF